ncbi:MAG: alpha-mannosidase [Chthonomonadales bacterium]
MPYTLHVVSHTHWDREWFMPFQQFRLRLVDLVDHLLQILDTDPDFHYFNLDAQTIVLEDYLQIRPQRSEELKRYIAEGRITVGPWYQLNDQFLTSGEATVRSLLVGHRIAASFGGVMKVGYLPDQFGNLSQMPQILRGFGIDNAVVGRGYQLVGDRTMEFLWEAPDGTQVLGSLMAFWYNNAQRIPSDLDEAVQFVMDLKDRMAPRSSSSHLLLMNGVDHLEAQPDVGRIIAQVNRELERRGIPDRLVHSTLPQYIAALREELGGTRGPRGTTCGPLQVKQGELREDRWGACLAGTLSTRMYIKQANHRAQTALEQYAERLSSFARLHGAPYPHDELLYAWKLLMQNHPHDSICGCSVDQVHREMMPRFQQVEQVAEVVTEKALDVLTRRDRTKGAVEDAFSIFVFNPLNWMRTDPVRCTLEFPLGAPARGNPGRDARRALRGFSLSDAEGRAVPFAVIACEEVIRQVISPHELPLDQWVQRITIEFVASNVPGCGWRIYTIRPEPSWPHYPDLAVPTGEPDPLALWMPLLEDVGDVGDEYLFRSPRNDRRILVHPASLPGMSGEEHYASCVRRSRSVRGSLMLPAAGDLEHRAGELVECPVVITATQWAEIDRVEVELEFENRARDHRLRAVWNVESAEALVAGGQFDAVRRPVPDALVDEGAAPFSPHQLWVDAAGEDGGGGVSGVAILDEGLPEHEAYPGFMGRRGMAVAITLLRCVGQLSRRGDGPGILTPEAQCPGRHTFRLAVVPHHGDWQEAKVWQQGHRFSAPLVAVQSQGWDGMAAQGVFLEVGADEWVVTCIKRAEDRDGLIIRWFNTVDEQVSGRVRVPGAKRMRRVNLNEEPLEDWSVGDTMALTTGGKHIETVEAEL